MQQCISRFDESLSGIDYRNITRDVYSKREWGCDLAVAPYAKSGGRAGDEQDFAMLQDVPLHV